MADYIEVDITTLEQDVKTLEEALKSVEKDMSGMFDSVAALNTMWDGPANEAFVQQFEIDHQVFGNLCTTIREIIDSIENAKDAYRKCENNVSDEINRIKI